MSNFWDSVDSKYGAVLAPPAKEAVGQSREASVEQPPPKVKELSGQAPAPQLDFWSGVQQKYAPVFEPRGVDVRPVDMVGREAEAIRQGESHEHLEKLYEFTRQQAMAAAAAGKTPELQEKYKRHVQEVAKRAIPGIDVDSIPFGVMVEKAAGGAKLADPWAVGFFDMPEEFKPMYDLAHEIVAPMGKAGDVQRLDVGDPETIKKLAKFYGGASPEQRQQFMEVLGSVASSVVPEVRDSQTSRGFVRSWMRALHEIGTSKERWFGDKDKADFLEYALEATNIVRGANAIEPQGGGKMAILKRGWLQAVDMSAYMGISEALTPPIPGLGPAAAGASKAMRAGRVAGKVGIGAARRVPSMIGTAAQASRGHKAELVAAGMPPEQAEQYGTLFGFFSGAIESFMPGLGVRGGPRFDMPRGVAKRLTELSVQQGLRFGAEWSEEWAEGASKLVRNAIAERVSDAKFDWEKETEQVIDEAIGSALPLLIMQGTPASARAAADTALHLGDGRAAKLEAARLQLMRTIPPDQRKVMKGNDAEAAMRAWHSLPQETRDALKSGDVDLMRAAAEGRAAASDIRKEPVEPARPRAEIEAEFKDLMAPYVTAEGQLPAHIIEKADSLSRELREGYGERPGRINEKAQKADNVSVEPEKPVEAEKPEPVAVKEEEVAPEKPPVQEAEKPAEPSLQEASDAAFAEAMRKRRAGDKKPPAEKPVEQAPTDTEAPVPEKTVGKKTEAPVEQKAESDVSGDVEGPLYKQDRELYASTRRGEAVQISPLTDDARAEAERIGETLSNGDAIISEDTDTRWEVQGGLLVGYDLDTGEALGAVAGLRTGRERTYSPSLDAANIIARGRVVRGQAAEPAPPVVQPAPQKTVGKKTEPVEQQAEPEVAPKLSPKMQEMADRRKARKAKQRPVITEGNTGETGKLARRAVLGEDVQRPEGVSEQQWQAAMRQAAKQEGIELPKRTIGQKVPPVEAAAEPQAEQAVEPVSEKPARISDSDFRKEYDKGYAEVLRWLMSKRRQDAEDIAQQTAAVMWAEREKYSPEKGTVPKLMLGIAKKLLSNTKRQSVRRKEVQAPENLQVEARPDTGDVASLDRKRLEDKEQYDHDALVDLWKKIPRRKDSKKKPPTKRAKLIDDILGAVEKRQKSILKKNADNVSVEGTSGQVPTKAEPAKKPPVQKKAEAKKVPWKPEAERAVAGTKAGTEMTLPDLFAKMQEVDPGLTLDEFKRDIEAMHNAGVVKLEMYTRAPNDIRDRPEAIDNPGEPPFWFVREAPDWWRERAAAEKPAEPPVKKGPVQKKPPAEQPTQKEPWEMTREEWVDARHANAEPESNEFALHHLSKVPDGAPGLSVEGDTVVYRNEAGKPVGVTTMRTAGGEKVVDDTAVHPDSRRQGIATKLYAKAAELGHKAGWVENKASASVKHKAAVQQALSEGKPVPRSVLEQYNKNKWAKDALAKLQEPESAETPRAERKPADKVSDLGQAGTHVESYPR
jgi:DNA-directed RNA polymerase specialized sigma24 family protein/GNAT superfamily N-acetyltransferase